MENKKNVNNGKKNTSFRYEWVLPISFDRISLFVTRTWEIFIFNFQWIDFLKNIIYV